MLERFDIDGNNFRLLRNRYKDQAGGVPIKTKVKQCTEIKKGGRQGRVVSPTSSTWSGQRNHSAPYARTARRENRWTQRKCHQMHRRCGARC